MEILPLVQLLSPFEPEVAAKEVEQIVVLVGEACTATMALCHKPQSKILLLNNHVFDDVGHSTKVHLGHLCSLAIQTGLMEPKPDTSLKALKDSHGINISLESAAVNLIEHQGVSLQSYEIPNPQ